MLYLLYIYIDICPGVISVGTKCKTTKRVIKTHNKTFLDKKLIANNFWCLFSKFCEILNLRKCLPPSSIPFPFSLSSLLLGKVFALKTLLLNCTKQHCLLGTGCLSHFSQRNDIHIFKV